MKIDYRIIARKINSYEALRCLAYHKHSICHVAEKRWLFFWWRRIEYKNNQGYQRFVINDTLEETERDLQAYVKRKYKRKAEVKVVAEYTLDKIK